MKKIYKKKYYLNYLNKSLLGHIYRRFILFPFFSSFIKKNDVVLDYGCGLGFFLKYVSKKTNIVGCDINDFFAANCNKNKLNAKFIEKGDILPFKNSYFDSVFMDNVLEHIEDPSTTIIEIYNKLKNNGLLVIGVPGKKGFESDDDHKIYYDVHRLKDMLENYKFEFINAYYLPFFIKSKFLDKYFRNYCLYMILKKIS